LKEISRETPGSGGISHCALDFSLSEYHSPARHFFFLGQRLQVVKGGKLRENGGRKEQKEEKEEKEVE